MKVKRKVLLLLACLVWGVAGFNVLRIGLVAYGPYVTVLNLVLSAVVFVLFQQFVFGKLVKSTRPESMVIRKNGISSSNSLTKRPL